MLPLINPVSDERSRSTIPIGRLSPHSDGFRAAADIVRGRRVPRLGGQDQPRSALQAVELPWCTDPKPARSHKVLNRGCSQRRGRSE
jgi:hypothetical protein